MLATCTRHMSRTVAVVVSRKSNVSIPFIGCFCSCQILENQILLSKSLDYHAPCSISSPFLITYDSMTYPIISTSDSFLRKLQQLLLLLLLRSHREGVVLDWFNALHRSWWVQELLHWSRNIIFLKKSRKETKVCWPSKRSWNCELLNWKKNERLG